MWIVAVALAPALAADKGPEPTAADIVPWKTREIETRVLTDVSAYTVGQGRWRLGLQRQQYGVLDNFALGTTTALWIVGAANVNGKVTAIQTKRVDVSLGGEYIRWNAGDAIPGDVSLTLTPVKTTFSLIPHRRWGLHLGYAATIASLKGQIGGEAIAEALESVIGVDLGDSIDLSGGGVYAGANLTLQNVNLAVEYRMNRRDSLVFSSKNYLVLNGLVAAGANVGEVAEGAEVEAGGSARIRYSLANSVPTLNALSWQWSWPKFHLRLGIPFPNFSNAIAFSEAIEFYWVLGKGKDERFGTRADRMSRRKRRKIVNGTL